MSTPADRAKQAQEPLLIRLADLFPWPFTLSIYLTLTVMALAVYVLRQNPNPVAWADMANAVLIDGWFKGVSTKENIAFAFEICLIIVSGSALVQTRFSESLIARLARVADYQNPMLPTIALVSFVAVITGLLNWGLSLVFCATLGRRINEIWRQRGQRDAGFRPNYAVIGAACYLGLLVWHGGLSGSAPLLANDTKAMDMIVKQGGKSIPITETTFSTTNGIACLMLWLPLAATLLFAHLVFFRKQHRLTAPPPPDPLVDEYPRPPDSRLAIVATILLAILGLAAAAIKLTTGGRGEYTVELFAFAMLCVGLLCSPPEKYVHNLRRTTALVVPIILQYPLYCGILGIFQAKDSRLIVELATQGAGLLDHLGAKGDGPFLVFTYAAACLINLFVPSGGAQWMLQGPVFLQMAHELGIEQGGKIVLAIAYGDQTTKMMQPFWVLTVCHIMGIRSSQVLAFSSICMLPAAAVFLICLLRF